MAELIFRDDAYAPAFLREKGLPVPRWLEERDQSLPDVRQ